jgi:hypothetical protein
LSGLDGASKEVFWRMSHFKPLSDTYIVEAPHRLARRSYAGLTKEAKLADLPTSQIA